MSRGELTRLTVLRELVSVNGARAHVAGWSRDATLLTSPVIAALDALVDHDATHAAHEAISFVTLTSMTAHRVSTFLLARVHGRIVLGALVDVFTSHPVSGESRRTHALISAKRVHAG